MSDAPGSIITRQDEHAGDAPATAWSTQFFIGETERGPDQPVPCSSLSDYTTAFGGRTLESQATYDEVDKHFEEDGGLIYVQSLRGDDAEHSSVDLLDASNLVSLHAEAVQPGPFWDGTSIDVDRTGSSFKITITPPAPIGPRTSPLFTTQTAAQAWAQSKAGGGLFTLTPGAGDIPVATTNPGSATTGGDDDHDGIDLDSLRVHARKFGTDLGPGRLRLPGRSAPEAHLAVADTLSDIQVNRLLSADLPDTSDEAALVAHAALLNAHPNADCIDMLAQRWVYQGLAADSPGIYAGASVGRGAREATNDADGISPNQPAAGKWGASRAALKLSREFKDPDVRARLNAVGINVSIMRKGRPTLFGARTAALSSDNAVATRIGSARLRLAVIDLLQAELDETDFEMLDPSGIALGNVQERCKNVGNRFPTSFYKFDVTAKLVATDNGATARLELTVTFQAAYDAEVIRAVVTRQIPTLTEA